MTVIRRDKTHKLTDLPILSSTRIWYNGQVGYTGSLITRPVKGSGGIYKHTGLIYGSDRDGVIWIIENNANGVECITLRDFHLGLNYKVQLNLDPLMIDVILGRANERATEKYHARDNNCESFTNYCITGTLESQQAKSTEMVLDMFLSVSELYIATYSETKFLASFSKLRRQLNIERSESVDKALNKMIKNKNELKPMTVANTTIQKIESRKNAKRTKQKKAE